VANPSNRADVDRAFTIEWWMRGRRSENPTGTVSCGMQVYGWTTGHTIVDRDRWPILGPDGQDFGVAVDRNGRLAFGVQVGPSTPDAYTVCTSGVNVLDDRWHHVAVQRRTSGVLEIWVDGVKRGSASGPPGSLKFPTGNPAHWSPNDPFLVLGAEKHDVGPSYPSYSGWLDEFRLSTVVRYHSRFTPPRSEFRPDANTALLFHFNRAVPSGTTCTTSVRDAAGTQNGACRHGGPDMGPKFANTSPFRV